MRLRRSDRERIAGAVSGLIFNAALFAFPFATIAAWRAYEAGDIYAYASTPSAEAATREALDQLAATFVPAGAPRTDAWREMVARELSENDYRAAHGALLTAPAVMAPTDANRMLNQLPAQANDDQIALAALALLPEAVRTLYQSPPESGRDAELLGDAADLRLSVAQWLASGEADTVMLAITGVMLSWPDSEDPVLAARARGGASVLKIARRTGRLSPAFNAYLARRVDAVAPIVRLRTDLSAALGAATGDEENAVLRAFATMTDRDARALLARDLIALQTIARATDPVAAAQLLEQVDTDQDLAQLALAAQAGRDRAVFIAKRGDRGVVLTAAKGTLYLTSIAWWALGGLAACILGMGAMLAFAIAQALTREWRGEF
jgi:hypothetical protein